MCIFVIVSLSSCFSCFSCSFYDVSYSFCVSFCLCFVVDDDRFEEDEELEEDDEELDDEDELEDEEEGSSSGSSFLMEELVVAMFGQGYY